MPSTPLNSVMPPVGVQLSKRSAKFQVDPAVIVSILPGQVMMLDLQVLASNATGATTFGEIGSVWATVVDADNDLQSATTAPGISETVPYVLSEDGLILDPLDENDVQDGIGEFTLWHPGVQAFCSAGVSGSDIGAVMRAGGTTGFRVLLSDDTAAASKKKRVAIAHEDVAGVTPVLTYCWFDGWNGFQGSANLAAPST